MTRTVLITGCSSGFGKAAVDIFARNGWNVVRTMRSVPDDREDEPANIATFELDITDKAAAVATIDAARDRFGRIDVLVNNAGVGLLSIFEATPDDAARQVFETNIFGLFTMVRTILPLFGAQGGGRIVNISSGTGFVPTPLMSIYSASKQAVEAFSESLSHELASQNVAVKLVEPGYVPGTNFTGNVIAASAVAPTPPTYQGFFDTVMAAIVALQAGLATDIEVGEAIYSAACDDSDRLRFVVGADCRQYQKMRHETSEEEYLAWVRQAYGIGARA
jgi:NAD(P)-dependent dehydrogenase (short-subunit alcohol dehydrogenase family)